MSILLSFQHQTPKNCMKKNLALFASALFIASDIERVFNDDACRRIQQPCWRESWQSLQATPSCTFSRSVLMSAFKRRQRTLASPKSPPLIFNVDDILGLVPNLHCDCYGRVKLKVKFATKESPNGDLLFYFRYLFFTHLISV
jgi:hypothetical protein